MKCLDNFIKFRSLCADEEFEASGSGLYWENLEGLSLGKVSDFTDSKFNNAVHLSCEKSAFASSLLVDEALMVLPNHRYKSAVRLFEFGNWQTLFNSPEPLERGIKLTRLENPLTFTYLEKVRVYSETTGDFQIKVYEGLLTTTPTVFPISLISGEEVEITLNFKTFNKRVYILLDNTSVSTNNSWLNEDFRGELCDCQKLCCDSFHVEGWDGARESYKTYGIKLEASLRCDKEELICRLSDELKYAILYRGGVEILKEAGFTERANFVVFHNLDKVDETITKWERKAREYLQAGLDGVSDYLNSLHCPCIECKKDHLVTILP